MAVTAGSPIRYSDLISTMYNSLRSLPQNLDSYAASVPNYLRYPYTDTQSIGVSNGYTPKINWTNNSYCATVSSSAFQNDFNTFMDSQALSLNQNINSTVKGSLITKLLTAMYCYVTSRFVWVFHPRYTGQALFVCLSLQPTIDTTNVANLLAVDTDANMQAVISSLCNQAKSGARSLMVTNSYNATF